MRTCTCRHSLYRWSKVKYPHGYPRPRHLTHTPAQSLCPIPYTIRQKFVLKIHLPQTESLPPLIYSTSVLKSNFLWYQKSRGRMIRPLLRSYIPFIRQLFPGCVNGRPVPGLDGRIFVEEWELLFVSVINCFFLVLTLQQLQIFWQLLK